MNFKQKLRKLEACEDAVGWVRDRDLLTAWAQCQRGDWMLWWAAMAGADIRAITLAKGRTANLVRHLMADPRSTAAVDAAIAFGEGRISEEELAAAYAAAYAYAAYAAAYAAYAAAYAAYAAAYADYAADYADYAADYADYAAGVTVAAGDAGGARAEILRKSADICREVWPVPPGL